MILYSYFTYVNATLSKYLGIEGNLKQEINKKITKKLPFRLRKKPNMLESSGLKLNPVHKMTNIASFHNNLTYIHLKKEL